LRLVADASALAEYILQTERADAIACVLTAGDVEVHVPHLCDVEIAAALRRASFAGKLAPSRLAEAASDYLDLPLIRHVHENLFSRILELRRNFSAYDATYVALAESLGVELLTADRSLARAVTRHLELAVVPCG
jgi:predicted nucleic acid-binding protein